jgi:hypothetical protein
MGSHIGVILLAIGLYTALALPQFFAPRFVLSRVTFGVDTADPLTLLLARHWALLATCVGGLLVYAAYHPEVRAPAIFIAAVEKLALSALLFFGGWKRTAAATRLAAADAVLGVALVLCLLGVIP